VEKHAALVKPPGKAAWVVVWGVAACLFLTMLGDLMKEEAQTPGTPFFLLFGAPGLLIGLFSPRRPYRNGLIVLGIVLLGMVLTLREGVACVLFALPLLLPVLVLGIFVGNVLSRWLITRRAKATAALVALAAQAAWQSHDLLTDDPARHPWHVVEAVIDVAAPPEDVFRLLTASELSLGGPWPRVITLGLPVPRSLRVEAPGVGGSMRLGFNHGTATAAIVAWEPGRVLAFELRSIELHDPPLFRTRLSADEHFGLKAERVSDWLTFGRLEFRMEPRAGFGTRLTRVTRFQRHLFPSVYFEPLQHYVIRAGSERLLEQLKTLAEARDLAARSMR
jgi:uncharacterized protein YndB with AHSA1/START domain